MDENKFEDRWRATVSRAEVEPSVSVWSNVESALIAAENLAMKGSLVFYRRLAAASLIFAILLGAAGFYLGRKPMTGQTEISKSVPSQVLPQATTDSKNDVKNKENAPENNGSQPAVVMKRPSTLEERKNPDGGRTVLLSMTRMNRDNVPPNPVTPTNQVPAPMKEEFASPLREESASAMKIESRDQKIVVADESPVKIKKAEKSIEVPGVAQPVESPEIIKKEHGRYAEDVWASVIFSAGSFNPGTGASYTGVTSPGSYNLSAGNPISSSTSRPGFGTAYTAGFIFGKRLAERWVVQGGINYLNQSNSYVSNVTTAGQPQALDLFNFNSKNASSVTFTNPYPINSILEFISVPMQAGYLLLNRKVGFQVNGGVAADFFVRNSLQDESGQANAYSQGAGSASPYRSVNWAGLLSSELSYRLARQYRISLVPGIRYLFNPTLKSGAMSNSYMADIGFRFRYILK